MVAAWRAPGRLWLGLGGALALGSLLAWWLPALLLDWQPRHAASQPWRAWTAALVHWSPQHLATNLLATAVVAAYGWAARLPARAAVAWLLAWPLTQLGLLWQPALLHYGGVSGVLHAGVAITTLWLVLAGGATQRAIGAAVLTGLLVKLWSEDPLGAALRHWPEWDIAVAPLAHTSGALMGALALLLVWLPGAWRALRARAA
jgi:rhomboid family GlyGly-CTERM serine protease